MKTLVIGYGNPLRRDDGLGWLLANQLSSHNLSSHLDVRVSHQLMPEMTEAISQAKRVIFVDATYGEQIGHWECTKIELPKELESLSSLVHHLSPTQLLSLTKQLYRIVPPAHMITVVGKDFDYGEVVSPTIRSILPDIMTYILQEFVLEH